MFTLNCRGKIFSFSSPVIMGIINVTPDSFFEGDLDKDIENIIQKAGVMIDEGADMIDIGGQSTRPHSRKITSEEETERVIPVIEAVHATYPNLIISIDTFYSKVAIAAIKSGATIVNDISSGAFDEAMIPTVAKLEVPYICMHMKGTPENMQQFAVYENLLQEVLDYLIIKTNQCKKAGIHDVIIDPGFGFAKTIAHNFLLLKNLPVFKIAEKPVLAGISRKSMIYKTLNTSAAEALNGTTVLHTIALQNGADILRVHDVKQAKEAVMLYEVYKKTAL